MNTKYKVCVFLVEQMQSFQIINLCIIFLFRNLSQYKFSQQSYSMMNTNFAHSINHTPFYAYSSQINHPNTPKLSYTPLFFTNVGNHIQTSSIPQHRSSLNFLRHTLQLPSKQTIYLSGNTLNQNMRHQLPHHLSHQKLIVNPHLLLTRTNSSIINQKISFTYTSPPQPLVLPSNTKSSIASFLQYQKKIQQQRSIFKVQKLSKKKKRNQLCSLVFDFTYIPQKKEQSNYFSKILEQTTLNKFQEFSKKTNYNSKIASTIATQSFNQNRRSDFSSQDKTKNLISDQRISYFGKNVEEELTDIVPIDKQLGKTIFIQGQDYTFGGIIHVDPNHHPFPVNKSVQNRSSLKNYFEGRQWNNSVKCLIQSNMSHIEQNLKYSIHQGPQIRQQHHKFQLLNDFGRQIKESTMQLHE